MMKKSIFAVAVASVLTLGAAQAETVLYGSIRYDYQNKKTQSINSPKAVHSNSATKNPYTDIAVPSVKYVSGTHWSKANSKRLSNLEDAGSRIGIKGSEDLGNGTAVIYNLEWGFNGMDGLDNGEGFKNRLAILGLTGDWGTFTAGRQNNPFKVTIVDDTVTDGFNGSDVISSAAQRAMTSALNGAKASVFTAGLGNDYSFAKPNADGTYPEGAHDTIAQEGKGPSFTAGGIDDGASYARVGKVIAYTTPDFAGFQANVALMMDDSLYGTNDEKNIDLWTINAKYQYDLGANGAILAKLGYIQGKLADRNKSKMWGAYLGYLQDAFSVTASYANGNHKPYSPAHSEKDKYSAWDLGASYSFGPNYFSTIRAAYGENQIKTAGRKDKVKSWAVGFEQKLSTRTRAWVEYGNEETKYHNVPVKKKDNVVSIGMRHDF